MGEWRSTVSFQGIVCFDPRGFTKKHRRQGEWKKHAMIQFEGDICGYYSWFIKKRYNLELLIPMRGPHISFVSDKAQEIKNWDQVKEKYHGQKVDMEVDLTPRTDSVHWWFEVRDRWLLNNIRAELGLGAPYFDFHMSLGRVKETHHMREHGKYIEKIHKKIHRL